ncbi:MAG: tRNA uridine-5-carboxymethylaminomethyl(34) synthesis enzyme MnmG [bacterium]|nr:tRNA uridine-5-carboxymethylaminomethyl(34) synthesis enzyme MnmG [bacterium]
MYPPHPCSTWNIPGPPYDLVVVGAGHAGIEAALAGARMGLRTLIITMSLQTIGQMSCNPAIGGVGKGQLVREIDALGGEMGRLADLSGIQFRMLNRSKGAAVWSPRAQCDKWHYARMATQILFNQPGLDLRQGQVVDLAFDKGRIRSVLLDNGTEIPGRAFILCAGTFLNGLIHVGDKQRASGRAGEPPAHGLSAALERMGVAVARYKTGTPPRVDRESIDFSSFELQPGDTPSRPFRFYEHLVNLPQLPCHLTWTTEETHRLLRENLHLSPMYSGRIESIGPRYCPSVEDKVVRFADKDRHQLFLEPESLDGREMYVNGFSTSLPEEIQWRALRTVPGFEHVRLIRPGYAIEYDYFPAWQINIGLSLHEIPNLFLAGQINGTSGYEEAAAQGLLAAINAAALLDGKDPLVLGRDQAYIGVLVDDLVNKSLLEPYRMFTSRAEFRLLLRQDNADERLMEYGRRCGLLEEWRWQTLLHRRSLRERIVDWLMRSSLPAGVIRQILSTGEPDGPESPQSMLDQPPCSGSQRAAEWLRRPDVKLNALLTAAGPDWSAEADEDLLAGIELDVKYAGYIERQHRAVANFRRNEGVALPKDLDYASVSSLSTEARQHLGRVKPHSLGQASRIGGVNPTDVQALWVHLQRRLLPGA